MLSQTFNLKQFYYPFVKIYLLTCKQYGGRK
nr:MAG TPA: hypothetical protein [Caudoviricetes sp.]